MLLKCLWKGEQVGSCLNASSALCMQTIDGLEADVSQGKKDAGTQAESAAIGAKALTSAHQRLESAAAAKTELEQRIAELRQQLAPFEGRVQAAIAETKVNSAISHPKADFAFHILSYLCMSSFEVPVLAGRCRSCKPSSCCHLC